MNRMLMVLAFLAFGFSASAQDAPVPAMVITAPAEVVAAPPTDTGVAMPDNTWTIPYGQMIDGASQTIRAALLVFIMSAVAWVSRLLPGFAGVAFRMVMSNFGERLIANAVDFGINATKGAKKGATFNIPVGSAVIAHAAEYATQVGWKYLLDYLGGVEGIKQKIFRKIDLEPHVTPETVGVRSGSSQAWRFPVRR